MLEGVRAVRIGQIMDPTYPIADEAASSDFSPPPPEVTPPAPEVAARPAARPSAAQPAARPPGRSHRVLAVFNHKGGTGKTTTAVHVAAGLAAKGQRDLGDGQEKIACRADEHSLRARGLQVLALSFVTALAMTGTALLAVSSR